MDKYNKNTDKNLHISDFINKNYPEKNFNADNVMLSATHTHSAFGGFSHY